MAITIDPEFDLLRQFVNPYQQTYGGQQPINYLAGLTLPTVAPTAAPITAQPVAQPQVGEAGEIGFLEGLGILASQVPTMVTDILPMTFQQSLRALTQDMTLEDRTELDRLIAENKAERERARVLTPEEREKTFFKVPFTDVEIKAGDLENAADSLGYSIANMGALLAGRAASAALGTMVGGPIGGALALGGGIIGGLAAGTGVTGGAMFDEFMGNMRDKFLATYAPTGEITPELEARWAELRKEIASDARWYGFWEAAPETVGNMLMLQIGAAGKLIQKPIQNLLTKKFQSKVAKRVGKEVARFVGVPATQLAAMVTEESLTEMVTQKKQADIEYQNGLRDAPITYGQALKEVLPMVLTTTPLLGGATTVVQSVANKVMKGRKEDITETEREAIRLINEEREREGMEPLNPEDEQWVKARLGTITEPAEEVIFERYGKELEQAEEDAMYERWLKDLERQAELTQFYHETLTEAEKRDAFQQAKEFEIEKIRRAAEQRGPQDPALRAVARQRERPLAEREEADRAEVERVRNELAETVVGQDEQGRNQHALDPAMLAQIKRQEVMELIDIETGRPRAPQYERDINKANRTAEALAERFDKLKSKIPFRLRGAMEIMRRHVAEGAATGYRIVTDFISGNRVLVPGGTRYRNWFNQKHYNPPFKTSKKDKQGVYYQINNRDFQRIADKLEKGKDLTDRQQWIYDNAIAPAAEEVAAAQPEVTAENDISLMESEGWDVINERRSPAELTAGQDVLRPGPNGPEEWHVINEANEDGNTVLANGDQRQALSPFDIIEVIATRENALAKSIRRRPESAGGMKKEGPRTERREAPVREGGVWSPQFRAAVKQAKNSTPEQFVDWAQRKIRDGSPIVYELSVRFGRKLQGVKNIPEVLKIIHARIARDMQPLKRFAEMNDAEKEFAANGDFLTGLRGVRAWELEDDRLKNVVALDLDAMKWFNDNLGHHAGDEILITFAEAMMASGLPPGQLYRTGGDEFFMQDNNSDNLDAAIERIQEYLDNNPLDVIVNNRPLTYRLEFSYGKAQTTSQSEDALRVHKAAREAEGTRPARGEIPPQIVRQLAEGFGIRYPGSEIPQTEIDAARQKYLGHKIVAAAIRLPDGKIVTGVNHGDAFTKLSEQEQDYSPLVDGFVTDDGTFLVRELAATITDQPSQQSADIVGRTVADTTAMRLGESVINTIPMFATVKRPVIVEETGKQIEVEENARDTLREYDNEIETFYELLGCVA